MTDTLDFNETDEEKKRIEKNRTEQKRTDRKSRSGERKKMSKILVVGASGTVGTELVKILKNSGHQVAAATSKEVPAAGQVHLNLVTKVGLTAAVQDVDKAFLLAPPGHTNQHELLIPLIDEAKRQGVKKIVLMTAMGANANEAAPMRMAESHLEKSGLSYNIIRPNWFMQNFNTFWMAGILADSNIYLPVGKAKGSFIDARDIAATAAALLDSDEFKNRDFDLTGSDVLDHDQAAEILSSVSGQKIEFQDITPDKMLQGLLQAGTPKDYAEFLVMILGYFKEGYSARVTDSVQKITGHAPTSFKKYAQDYKSNWLKSSWV
jgi:uncharacterized protein YbjT (DUF2867 family)